jgi:hypothetical protein
MPPWQPPASASAGVSPRVKETRAGPNRTVSHEKHSRHRRRQSEPGAAGPESSGTITPTTAKGGVGQNHDDLDVWQTASPFASLARGMGGGLSQGLGRHKDDRKKNRSVAIAVPKGKWK